MIKIYNNLIYFFIKILNILQKIINSILIKFGLKYFSNSSSYYYKNIYSNSNLKGSTTKERISQGLINDKYIKYFNFLDGNSFLEIGCGYGVNLIEIKKKFPQSDIFGCDIHDTCLGNSDYFNKQNFKKIDLKVFDSLKTYETNSIDNVYIMHSLTHIMDKDKEKTLAIRKNIVQNMIRISKKKVFIIENKIYYGSRYNFDGINLINTNDSIGKNRVEYFNNLKEILPDDTVIKIFSTEYRSNIFEILRD
tara:strand:+ start:650 stop:1399 length:750 start_codon:yes stop_codon:yes gene_type:complete